MNLPTQFVPLWLIITCIYPSTQNRLLLLKVTAIRYEAVLNKYPHRQSLYPRLTLKKRFSLYPQHPLLIHLYSLSVIVPPQPHRRGFNLPFIMYPSTR